MRLRPKSDTLAGSPTEGWAAMAPLMPRGSRRHTNTAMTATMAASMPIMTATRARTRPRRDTGSENEYERSLASRALSPLKKAVRMP